MIDPNVAYEIIKFWLPMLSGFLIVIKAYSGAKKNIGEYASKLLNNHLHSIQEATTQTVVETQKTNTLLATAAVKNSFVADRVLEVKDTLAEHHEKEAQVWSGILQTLAILEDRSRKSNNARRKR